MQWKAVAFAFRLVREDAQGGAHHCCRDWFRPEPQVTAMCFLTAMTGVVAVADADDGADPKPCALLASWRLFIFAATLIP